MVSPNSTFLYVALPNYAGVAQLAVYSIDPSTGILSQVGSNLQVGYPMSQLVMAPSGSALYGLARASSNSRRYLAWTLNSSSGVATRTGHNSGGRQPHLHGSVGERLLHVRAGPHRNDHHRPIVNAPAAQLHAGWLQP